MTPLSANERDGRICFRRNPKQSTTSGPIFLTNHEVDAFSYLNVIKSRRMRWTGHVERMDERRGVYRDLVRERDYLGDPGIDGRIILRWIFGRWDVGVWTGSSWLRIGTVGGQL